MDRHMEVDGIYNKSALPHMVIKHESLRAALLRQEKAARTEEDFEKLTVTWDRLDENREQREQRHEKISTERIKDFRLRNRHRIIPAPLEHIWWRELLRGDFLSVIHDCPLDIQDLIENCYMYEFVGELNQEQKEVLYYRAIRYWSNQQIAAMCEQTDRNILKKYDTLIESIRYKLYMRLLPRFKAKAPLTLNQKAFMECNQEKYGDGKPKRKRRAKAEMEAAAANAEAKTDMDKRDNK